MSLRDRQHDDDDDYGMGIFVELVLFEIGILELGLIFWHWDFGIGILRLVFLNWYFFELVLWNGYFCGIGTFVKLVFLNSD